MCSVSARRVLDLVQSHDSYGCVLTKCTPPHTHTHTRAHLAPREPERVALAYTEDSEWRNRGEFIKGREAIRQVSTMCLPSWMGWPNVANTPAQLLLMVKRSAPYHICPISLQMVSLGRLDR